MISLIVEEIDTLRDWFGVNFTEIRVPCTHCFKEKKDKPYMFTLLECELASCEDIKALKCPEDSLVSNNSIPLDHCFAAEQTFSAIVCEQAVLGKGAEVPLVELVPDIAMTQYKQIPYSKIELGAMIGKGGTLS